MSSPVSAELDVASPRIVTQGQTIQLSCTFALRDHQSVDFWADHKLDPERTRFTVHNRPDAVVVRFILIFKKKSFLWGH